MTELTERMGSGGSRMTEHKFVKCEKCEKITYHTIKIHYGINSNFFTKECTECGTVGGMDD